MTVLIIGALAFLVTHLGVSSTPLRAALVGKLGLGPYLGLYSVVSAGTLGLLIYGYIGAPHTDFLWLPGKVSFAVAKVIMPFALIFLLSGLMSRNPTSVGQDAAVRGELSGIFRIVRHPVQWGFALWAIAHLVANPDLASLVFFGTFVLVSMVGMAGMDAKRRSREEPEWQEFYATTSYFPLFALASGRTRLGLADLNWMAISIGVILYVLVYAFHDWVSGVALM